MFMQYISDWMLWQIVLESEAFRLCSKGNETRYM